MTPLMNAPSVIPQLILNLCTVSIATCNKIFNQMTPFNGTEFDLELQQGRVVKRFLGYSIQGLQLPV